MGIAIIGIVLFHYYEDLVRMKLAINPIVKIFSYGNLGIDMFLFISGVGLCFSYKSNSNKRIFYKKRFKKIIILYLLISRPFWIWRDIILEHSFKMFFMDISMISFFTEGNRQLWFIALIIILYIVFPYIYKVIYKDIVNGVSIQCKLILLIGVVLIINGLIYFILQQLYSNIEIALTRIPAFIMGCYYGSYIYEEKIINKKFLMSTYIFIILVKGSLGFITNQDLKQILTRYLGVCIGIILCITVSIVLELIRCKKNNNFFDFFGSFTLELYMVHVLVRSFINYYNINYSIYGVNNYIIIASLVLSILINRINKRYI